MPVPTPDLYKKQGGEFRIGPDDTSMYSAIASLEDGGFVVSFLSTGDSTHRIHTQRYNSDGTLRGGIIQVGSFTGRGDFAPAITGLLDGGYVVTWQTDGVAVGDYGVYARGYNADGTARGAAFRVGTSAEPLQGQPAISTLADGGYVVAWQYYDGDNLGIHARAFEAGGSPRAPEFLVNTTTERAQALAAITSLADGGYVITWHSRNEDQVLFSVYAQAFNADGSKRGGEFHADTTGTVDQESPAAAGLVDGSYVLTWHSYGQDGSDAGIRAQAFNADGSKRGGEFQVNTTTSERQFEAAISALADGGYIITWQHFEPGGHQGIYAKIFDADGTPRGNEFAINAQPPETSIYAFALIGLPAVVGTADDGFVISWFSRASGAGNPAPSIHAQVFAPSEGVSDLSLSKLRVSESAPEDVGLIGIGSAGSVNAALAYEIVSDTSGGAFGIANGHLVVADNAKLDFTAAPTVTITLRATDIVGGSYEESFTLTILDAPNGSGDGYTTGEDSVLTVGAAEGVLGNDNAPAGGPLGAVLVSGPAHGALSLNTDGSFTYTPVADYSGPDSFTYQAGDGEGYSDPTVVDLTVTAINDLPRLISPVADRVVDEDSAWTFTVPANTFGDVDGDTLTYGATLAGGGAIPNWLTFNAATRTFRGTPPTDFAGTVALTVTASDQAASIIDTFTLTVIAVNDAPVAADDMRQASSNTETILTVAGLIDNDLDVDGDALSVTGVFNSINGGVKLEAGQIVFTPTANFTGTAGFDYTVSDGNGGADTGHVAVQVINANIPPTLAQIPALVTLAGVGIEIPIIAADANGDMLDVTATDPAHGAVVETDGRYYYKPDSGFNGGESFTVTVDDGRGGSASRTVNVSVVNLPRSDDWRLLGGSGFVGEIGGSGLVFGTNGFQDIGILDLPGGTMLDASFNRGGDVLRLTGAASEWRAAVSGSTVIFNDGDTFATVPFGLAGLAIVFDDGARVVRYDAAAEEVRIGTQTMSGDFSAIVTSVDAGPLPDAGDPDAAARILVASNAGVTAGGNIDVSGTNGNEIVHLTQGHVVLDGSFNRGGDTIVIDANAAEVTAAFVGSRAELDSGDLTIDIPIGPVGTTLAFADGNLTLIYDSVAGVLFIGDQEIDSSPAPLTFA